MKMAWALPIEIVELLGRRARLDLGRLGFRQVHLRIGDGDAGWPEASPFDTIIITCAPEQVPEPLVAQLREGGRMIVPVGGRRGQELFLLEKRGGELAQRIIFPVRFVPMTGQSQPRGIG